MSALQAEKPGLWLRLGYGLVFLYLAAILLTAVAGVILFPAFLGQHAASYTPNNAWSGAQVQTALRELGWPAESLGWFYFGLDLVVLSIGVSLSYLLLRRKRLDGFSLLLAFIFTMSGNTGTLFQPVAARSAGLDYFFNNIMGVVSWQLFFIALFFFPDGKPTPRWSRWIVIVWFIYMAWSLLNPNPAGGPLFWLAFILVFCAMGSQVYRQWKLTDSIQKQQTKWVGYAIVVMAVVLSLAALFSFKPPSAGQFGRDLVLALLQQIVFTSGFLFITIAILIAILRYRLYDIDLIIRRTLVYSLLTGLLVLVYFGAVTLLQSLFTTVSGQQSPAALVISTLLSAALFNPLRRRIQEVIDRRFYRRKYDAERALAGFAEAARRETNIDRISQAVEQVVEASLQPEKVRLWLAKK